MSFVKFATAEIIGTAKGSKNRLGRTASLDHFADYDDYRTDDGYIYVRVRAISSRVNKNHDGWPSAELAKSYRTFLGKPIFIDHNNSDPERARGVVVDAKLHVEEPGRTSGLDPYYSTAPTEHMPPTWIELLLETDAKTFPKLAKAVTTGEIDGVSMGCNVERSKCSHCGNIASVPEQYCQHIRDKGAEFDFYREGTKTSKKSYEDCYDIGFFEISYVFDPADETALVREIRSSEGMQKAASTRQSIVPTTQDVCQHCGAHLDPGSTACKVCGSSRALPNINNLGGEPVQHVQSITSAEGGKACAQCGKHMNPAEVMVAGKNGVCGDCARKNQKAVTGAEFRDYGDGGTFQSPDPNQGNALQQRDEMQAIQPHPATEYHSPDTIAETTDGITPDTYGQLWDIVSSPDYKGAPMGGDRHDPYGEHGEPTVEDPASARDVMMSNGGTLKDHWHKLTPEAQQNVNDSLAAEDAQYGHEARTAAPYGPAERVRKDKEANPGLYCPKCLWKTGGGPCPRHGGAAVEQKSAAGIPGWSGAPDAGGEGGAQGIPGWSGAPNTSAPGRQNFFEDPHEYKEYLHQTLIPDLHASGYGETAKDFETIRDHIHNGTRDPDYEQWLQNTLIPDTRASGNDFTADDLEEGIHHMQTEGGEISPMDEANRKYEQDYADGLYSGDPNDPADGRAPSHRDARRVVAFGNAGDGYNEMYDELGDDEQHNPDCPMCGGPGMELGSLGSRKHFRCRNCGMDFSHGADEGATNKYNVTDEDTPERHWGSLTKTACSCGCGDGKCGDKDGCKCGSSCSVCGKKASAVDVKDDDEDIEDYRKRFKEEREEGGDVTSAEKRKPEGICPVCGSNNVELWNVAQDGKCRNCGHDMHDSEKNSKTADTTQDPQAELVHAPQDVNTLRQEQVCPVCGNQIDDGKCNVCGFEEPPEGFGNPDLDAAQQVNQEQEAADMAQGGPGGQPPVPVPDAQGGPPPGPSPMGSPAPGQSAMPLQAAASVAVSSDRTSAASGGTKNGNPVLPVTQQATDRPKSEKRIQDSSKPVESSSREETMTDTRTAAPDNVADRLKSDRHRTEVADVAGVGGGMSEENPIGHKNVDVEGVGAVDNDENPEGHKEENLEAGLKEEVGDPTDTWQNGEGDSLGQHSPVGSEGDHSLASTKRSLQIFPVTDPKSVKLDAGLKEEVGPPTSTFGSDDFHITDPVTGEAFPVDAEAVKPEGKGVPDKGGFPPAAEGVKAARRQFMASLRLAETEVALGLIPAEQKLDRMAELEGEATEAIEAQLAAYSKVKTAGLTKTVKKTGGSLPSLRQSSVDRESSIRQVEASDETVELAESIFS